MNKSELDEKIFNLSYDALHRSDEEWEKRHGKKSLKEAIKSLLAEFADEVIGENITLPSNKEVYPETYKIVANRNRMKELQRSKYKKLLGGGK